MIARKEKELCIKISDKNITITRKIFQFKEFPEDSRKMCIRDSIVGAAIAIKKGCKRAADAAAAIGEGLQAFCIPGSVADTRKVFRSS